jgi:CheY-like chemotaxis protein
VDFLFRRREILPGVAGRRTTREDTMALCLVVDDEAPIRELIQCVLEAGGHEVIQAPDGAAALAAFGPRAGEIGVVLLDLTMPGIGGREVLCRMRDQRPGTPLILMSGYPADDALRDLPADRAAGFLQKPFTCDELTGAVDAALSGCAALELDPPR